MAKIWYSSVFDVFMHFCHSLEALPNINILFSGPKTGHNKSSTASFSTHKFDFWGSKYACHHSNDKLIILSMLSSLSCEGDNRWDFDRNKKYYRSFPIVLTSNSNIWIYPRGVHYPRSLLCYLSIIQFWITKFSYIIFFRFEKS